ncbi:PKD domain-containing protein [Rhizosphaericola mali]|nr:PKD domain-containing protein [Rhizosphaericola mali]
MKTKYFILLFLPVLLLFNSCKKDQGGTTPTINFSIAISGDTVRFTNLSIDANSFNWDFGDGDSSKEENPTHIYPGKGKYVPTLYAKSSSGGSANGSTVINISKTSPILLNDNTLSDWDTLSVNVYNSTAAGGNFIMGKFDYDANKIYFYFEMKSKVADGNIFDFYLDTDNSSSTGLLTSAFTGGGYDELLEGQLLLNQSTAAIPLVVYSHTGAQADFSFNALSLTDFFTIGTIVQDGDTLKFEGSFDRSKLSISNSTAIRLGIIATKSDWSATLGSLPDPNTDSYLLNLPN